MSEFRLKIKKQELRAAKAIGGTRNPCSGALFFAKGDATGKNYVAECKRTDKKSISIKAEVLDKITKEANLAGKLPLLFIELKVGSPFTSSGWVLIEENHFTDLIDGGAK